MAITKPAVITITIIITITTTISIIHNNDDIIMISSIIIIIIISFHILGLVRIKYKLFKAFQSPLSSYPCLFFRTHLLPLVSLHVTLQTN